jgi:hypothetical protein
MHIELTVFSPEPISYHVLIAISKLEIWTVESWTLGNFSPYWRNKFRAFLSYILKNTGYSQGGQTMGLNHLRH